MNFSHQHELEHTLFELSAMAFEEDLPDGDITAETLNLENTMGKAYILCREDVCMVGERLSQIILRAFQEKFQPPEVPGKRLTVTALAKDGQRLSSGSRLFEIKGPTDQMLAFERTFLNFISRGIGIANQVYHLIQLVRSANQHTKVLDTRKTLPGYRFFDKYAVLCGGGHNHRMSLSDQILIKENHIAKHRGVQGVLEWVHTHMTKKVPIEIEVKNLNECKEAIQAGCDIIMLDNFSPEQVTAACRLPHGSIQYEVSGGITKNNIERYCQAGVDRISIGSLTHSVIAPDLTMLVEEELMKVETDLIEEIQELKEKTDTVLLAHYYQDDDIQDIADFIGDSLDLARKAQKVEQSRILFAGVHFMAETAKILNPGKTVLIPDMEAGCSLAESCPAGPFSAFKEKYSDHIVVTYINCSSEIKALSDIIVTSSNAVKIIESLPKDQKIIFAPDKYLGSWVQKQTGREMRLWNGTCIVHESFNLKKLIDLKMRNPEAKVVAHPECPGDILNEADFIGSTRKILDFIVANPAKSFIIATEPGIIHQMKKLAPEKTFIPALNDDDSCSCNICPFMKLNTLEKIHSALVSGKPEITMEESIRKRAEKPLLEMLERS